MVSIKRRLADELEQARLRQIEQTRREKERARLKRAALRQEYIFKKADEFERLQKLIALSEHFERHVRAYNSDEVVDRLVNETIVLANTLAEGFERPAVAREIAGLELYAEGDAVLADDEE